MEGITVSAPGKVILFGEHAVVYGKTAVASSLDLRTYLNITASDDGCTTVSLPNINLQFRWKTEDISKHFELPLCSPTAPLATSENILQAIKNFAGVDQDETDTKHLAVVAFLYLYCSICVKDSILQGVNVKLSSKLPTSAGLGSSAAFSTTLASGFLMYMKHVKSSEPIGDGSIGKWTATDVALINDWAFQAEKIIHGNPSGIDNSVSTYGGALIFEKGAISPLTNVPTLRVLLCNTKVPRSTKTLVAGVRDRYDKYPDIIRPVLDSIEAISKQCECIFETMFKDQTEQDYISLQELISINQQLLCVLGVSHPTLNKICQTTSKFGYQSKLTGAGGGGCAFTLLTPGVLSTTLSQMKEELSELGFECWETAVGGHGVLQHFIINDSFSLPEGLQHLEFS